MELLCRYRFDVFMEGGEFRSSYAAILDLKFVNVIVDPLKMSFFPLVLLFIFVFGFHHFTMKLPTYGLLCIVLCKVH